jgi:hypothetical protein
VIPKYEGCKTRIQKAVTAPNTNIQTTNQGQNGCTIGNSEDERENDTTRQKFVKNQRKTTQNTIVPMCETFINDPLKPENRW